MSWLSTLPFLGGISLTVASGLFAHVIFKKFEPSGLYSVIVLLVIAPAVPTTWLRYQFASTSLVLLFSYGIYYVTLLLSILTYRLSPVHSLYKYPGPLFCKVSKLWMVYIASQGKQYLYFQKLHAKYGPIVRVGPNELSIADANLIPMILGPDGMPKGPLWEGRRISGKRGAGANNSKGQLIGARDKKVHAQSRRVWNRAFTTSAVKGYEPIVIQRATQLVEELKQRCLKNPDNVVEVDLSMWLSYCIFDWMGDMVFGGGFELMREGDKYGNYHTMVSGLYLPALTQHIPWFARALPYLPFVGKNMRALGEFAFTQVSRRLREGSVTNDLFYHLLDENPEDGKPMPFPIIMSNAVTAIIAGSDTTAVGLSNIIYNVLSNPICYARLRDEVDKTFPRGMAEPADAGKLANMEYLNAVINESLRLLPALPTSMQRAPTPGSEGHWISPHIFISVGTAVYVAPYVLQRSPQYFSPDPNKFLPERWLAGADDPANRIHNTSAFIPFSMGPANCVGKPVALLMLRMVLAYMVQAFDMCFAEGYDKGQWEEDLQDYFTFRKGKMPVMLTPRS